MNIETQIKNRVGHLYFEAYNGAMDLAHLERLLEAYQGLANSAEVRLILLWGGEEFFSNGIDLLSIDQRYNPTLLAYRNLKGINRFIEALLTNDKQLLMAGLRGPAAAGGVMLALAADLRYAAPSVVLNPHYVNMGLSGSEYFSLLLPQLVGLGRAQALLLEAAPLSAEQAVRLGLLHETIAPAIFKEELTIRAEFLANHQFEARLATKNLLLGPVRQQMLESVKAELLVMKSLCDQPGFAQARADFINKKPSPSFAQVARRNLR